MLKNSALTVKTVLFRIISIVRVPSLCFNKDTHDNFDDESQCFSLSVKLEIDCFPEVDCFLDERSRLPLAMPRRRNSPTEKFPNYQ